MKIQHLIAAVSFLTVLDSAQAAALTVANFNFQASGNDTNPTSWTTTEPGGSSVYVYVPSAGTNVLAMWGVGGNIQQSFSTGEATGETYGSYTVDFSYAYRNNTASSTFAFTFSLIDVTDNVSLASQTFSFPATPAAFDTYRALGTSSVTLTYDRTSLAVAGDTIALRIASVSGVTTDFSNTGTVDNIVVNATVPEPTVAVLGGIGVLGLLGRRRSRA